MIFKKSSVIHLLLLSIFPIIFLFSNNISQLYYYDIFIPIVLVLSIATIIGFILGLIMKNFVKSSIITSIGIFVFFVYGHFFNLLENFLGNFDVNVGHLFGIATTLIIFTVIVIFLVITKRRLDNLTKIISVVSVILISISAVNIATFYIFEENTDEIIISEIQLTEVSIRPNIYYIILDAYGSSESLKKYYDFDNIDFIEFLKNNEFVVPERSSSNYQSTILSVSSSLRMNYINDFFNEDGTRMFHKFFDLVNNNQVMKLLKQQGYEIYNIDSGWRPTNNIYTADHNLCGTNFLINSEFSTIIFSTSILKPIYANFFEQNDQQRVLCAFDEIEKISNNDGPFFILAHIVSPHPPYLFGPNGESTNSISLEFNQPSGIDEGYIGQLQFINKKTENIINKILEQDKSSIIVIISDHGISYSHGTATGNHGPSDEYIYEILSNFAAYHLPGKEEIIYEGLTPVNIFRLIFNTYFNTDFEILEDKNYFIDDAVNRNATILIEDSQK